MDAGRVGVMAWEWRGFSGGGGCVRKIPREKRVLVLNGCAILICSLPSSPMCGSESWRPNTGVSAAFLVFLLRDGQYFRQAPPQIIGQEQGEVKWAVCR